MKTYGENKLTIEEMLRSRKEAIKAKTSHYFTGKRCKYDHIAPRYRDNGQCVECNSVFGKLNYKYLKDTGEKVMRTHGPDKLTARDMKKTKSEALKAEHSHYFTGKVCVNGHIAPMRTKNATCVLCNRLHVKRFADKEELL